MQTLLQNITESYCLSNVLREIPVLHFYSELSICKVCGAVLKTEKVKQRTVYTKVYSKITIKEHVKKCPTCNKKYFSDRLLNLVKKHCNYAYDCIAEVGRLRYIEKRQISEIQEIFNTIYDLQISYTEIRRLSYQFLYYLGRFHYSSKTKINKTISLNGGYVLYIDSTCEGQAPHLLTCIDGITGFVLYSCKIKSENKTDLERCFKTVREIFGSPVCIVHDMGTGINTACDIVFEGVMRVICHFHLLRDIGKDLLLENYRKIQKCLSNKEIYASIRYQTKALEKLAGGVEKAEHLFDNFEQAANLDNSDNLEILIGMLYGYLLDLKYHNRNSDGYGFPFDMPKLAYYKRLIEIYNELSEIDKKHEFTKEIKKKSRFYKIKNVLQEITKDIDLQTHTQNIEPEINYFNDLRKIMRIAPPGDKKGLNDESKITTVSQLNKAETDLRIYIDTLQNKIGDNKEDNKKITGVIKQLEKYWSKIFTKPIKVKIGEDEKEIIPHRTNNISEQFYRKIKHLLRRLHGRPRVTKDLGYLPEELVLVENLKNETYVKLLFGNFENLSEKFARLDIDKIELPFEKNELNLNISQKIIKKLKKYNPIPIIKLLTKN
ncbi:MAG: hypothetical protein KAH72_06110 [Flavobacteriaceae bacterium]|nr:hypothetical protein [Flavobacteriaceae bacterium]